MKKDKRLVDIIRPELDGDDLIGLDLYHYVRTDEERYVKFDIKGIKLVDRVYVTDRQENVFRAYIL